MAELQLNITTQLSFNHYIKKGDIMTQTKQKTVQNKNQNMILFSIFIVFIVSIFFWNMETSKNKETYDIKKWQSSYINSTGNEVEDNKIKLSDGYWEGGKFGF